MQQSQISQHRYVNIGLENNESALVTSQYQSDHDSPKHQIDLSARENTEIKQYSGQKLKPSILKTPQIESDKLVSSDNSFSNINHQIQIIVKMKHPKLVLYIFDCIERDICDLGFKTVMRNSTQLLLLKQIHETFSEKLSNILCSSKQEVNKNNLIMIKYAHEMISVKIVLGDYHQNEDALSHLTEIIKSALCQDLNTMTDIDTKRPNQNGWEIHHLEQDIYQNPYYLDSASIYLVYKYLKGAQVQKQIQAQMKPIITQLKTFNGQTNKKTIEKEIVKIGLISQQLYEEVLSQTKHNLTRMQNQPLFPYYKLAFEKYLYEQVYQYVTPLYIDKYQNKEQEVWVKRNAIKQIMNPLQIMKFLDIKDKFTTLTKTQLDVYEGREQGQVKPPYFKAIQELEKINLMRNPREKLKCVQLMHCQMKADAVEYNNIKEELVTMDDELPIIIYVVLMAEFKNQYAEISYVEDFSNSDQTIENEKRVLTNIRVSLDYISNEWQV